MTAPLISLRREPFERALRDLSATELRVLVHLISSACPGTGRVWTSLDRLGDELGLTGGVVGLALFALCDRRFLVSPPALGRPRAIELGDILLRRGEAPGNVPFDPA